MKKKLFIGLLSAFLLFTACNTVTTPFMKTTVESGDKVAVLETTKGEIKILLYEDFVPETVKNFIFHVEEGNYDGVPFHRVISDFMVQTGDFENQDGTGGYSYKGLGTSIDDELAEGLSHIRGAVSMANAGPNTGGSQFFIVQPEQGTLWLDGKHAIFGYVVEGMDVVDTIISVETDAFDRPVEPVLIEKAYMQ